MSQYRTFRVLVRKTETYFVDLTARDEQTALIRAEKLWDGKQRSRFDRVAGHEPAIYEIDDMASTYLADIANEDRAERALKVLRTFASETGSEIGGEALRDLISDLGHYADEIGLDFEDELRRAAKSWSEEKAEGGVQ